jgi:hypothetical protein
MYGSGQPYVCYTYLNATGYAQGVCNISSAMRFRGFTHPGALGAKLFGPGTTHELVQLLQRSEQRLGLTG